MDTRLVLQLPKNLIEELERVAGTLGLHGINDAAFVAISEWISTKKAEVEARDPQERYFVNQALDELIERRR
jgi:hypothetical protein